MMRGALLIGVAVLLQSFSSVAVTNQQAQTQPTPAPVFKLKDLRGRTSRLSDYKGKVILINLWATWCAPCLVEMPELVKLQKKYGLRGLQIVGVAYPDEDAKDIRRIIQKFKLNYPVLYGTQELLEAYQIGEVLPATVVIDREGKIRDRILGILEPDEFKERIAPLFDSGNVH